MKFSLLWKINDDNLSLGGDEWAKTHF